MLTRQETGLRFSVSLARDRDPSKAGRALGASARRELGNAGADLAFLFFSAHYAPEAEDLCRAVREELTPRTLLGCTGEGIIAGSEEVETGSAAVLWAACLPEVRIAPFRLSFPQGADGFAIRGWPDVLETGAEPPACVLLADPFSTPINEVLPALADRAPGTAAIGGLAGGGHDLGENRLVFNDEVLEGGLVGTALSGRIAVRTIVSQGCRPIGEPFVVTKAEQNVIHELGGSPALDRLQAVFESLGSDERRIAHRALHIGIVIDEHRARFERGDFLVRNLIGADRNSGSVAIGDEVQEGQTVQFHLRDADAASEDLQLLLAAERAKRGKPPLGALLFSCCGRGRALFGRPNHDATTFRERVGDLPLAGFFAQGEIGPVGGSNFLHGYTASLALFSEPE
ncbi:MAG: FIST N-terminal domain-containing protein [Nitrospirota bacterium]